tara:strand:+ start:739 stop:1068 length:330 start_codon:yes stop_codon:yes gene_type:complete
MELGVRELVTVLGMAVSVGASLSIVKTKLQAVIDQLADVETRLRQLDRETDHQEVSIQTHEQKLDVMSSMLAPKEREARAREVATIRAELHTVTRDLEVLKKMHNGEHK